MVQSCSAYGCKNRYHKDKNVSFHKFPLARPDVCGKWISAMRRNNFKPTKYSNICSQHFTRDCFKRECNNRVLKENAVPSLFCFSKLQTKSESLEDPFPSEIDFPLALPLSDPEEEPPLLEQHHPDSTQTLHPATAHTVVVTTTTDSTGVVPAITDADLPPVHSTMAVSCDHNYTVEDSVQQKKRIEQLEEQLDRLRKKLKNTQQKCRRQERQLKRLKAAGEIRTVGREPAIGEGYVILPKEIYQVLKGIDGIE
ncbi:THAP domain-containing protein 1 [Diretmus argenteus]